MAAPKRPTAGEQLRAIASRLLDLADEYDIPSETTGRVERLVEHVERAADDVRAVGRGRR